MDQSFSAPGAAVEVQYFAQGHLVVDSHGIIPCSCYPTHTTTVIKSTAPRLLVVLPSLRQSYLESISRFLEHTFSSSIIGVCEIFDARIHDENSSDWYMYIWHHPKLDFGCSKFVLQLLKFRLRQLLTKQRCQTSLLTIIYGLHA